MHEVARINYIYDFGLKKGDLQCLPMAHVTPQLIIAPVERMQFFLNLKYFATYQLNMNISIYIYLYLNCMSLIIMYNQSVCIMKIHHKTCKEHNKKSNLVNIDILASTHGLKFAIPD